MKTLRLAVLLTLLASMTLIGGGPAALAVIPDEFTIVTILPDIKRATSFAYAPDGRIFISEKNGVIRVYNNGVGSVFLNFKEQVNDFGGRGLDSIALDPNFAVNHHVYLLFTEELRPDDPDQPYPANGTIRRITGTAANPYVADTSTWLTLFTGYDHQSQAHGVAGLGFDQQGNLLASFGDGYNTSVDPRHLNAQDLDQPNGKLLRINPATGAGVPGNPYFNAADPNSVRSRILARGFRNPWRFTTDPFSDDILVGDVGWGTWEEYNRIDPGTPNPDHDLNAGWPCYEGGNGVSAPQPGYVADPDTAPACNQLYLPSEVPGGTGIGSLAPTYGYTHTGPGAELGSAITMGPVYTGTNYPAFYRNKLWISDSARGNFRIVDPVTGAETDFGAAADFGSPVDIHIAPSGNIAYLSIVEQQLREIVFTGSNTPPVAVAEADVTSGSPPLTVHFTGDGSSDADLDPLTYDWDFGDGTPHSNAANPTHQYTTAGSFTATLTVTDGNPGGIATDTVLIDVGNNAPTISFTTPTPATTYRIGQNLPFEIVANDPEDGPLTGDSVSHDVILHHLGHVHFELSGTGTSGSYLVTDHLSDDTFLEFTATATDSLGRETTTSFFVQPQKVPVTLTSDPPGAQLVIDGTPTATPVTLQQIIGGAHQVSAPPTVTDATGTRTFDAWSSARLTGDGTTFNYVAPADEALELNADYGPAVDGISIGDASLVEGDDMLRQLAFKISLSAPQASTVTVNWATAAGSATLPQDFQGASGTATIPAGQVSANVMVSVKGDKRIEADEQLTVALSNPVGLPIADGLGVGRVVDDDPLAGSTLSIGDATVIEGDSGNRSIAFTVTLSEPPAGNVTVDYATVPGTALAGPDFTARSGSVAFTPTQRSKVVMVPVRGELARELSETFTVHLSNAVGATIADADGAGRIVTDELPMAQVAAGLILSPGGSARFGGLALVPALFVLGFAMVCCALHSATRGRTGVVTAFASLLMAALAALVLPAHLTGQAPVALVQQVLLSLGYMGGVLLILRTPLALRSRTLMPPAPARPTRPADTRSTRRLRLRPVTA